MSVGDQKEHYLSQVYHKEYKHTLHQSLIPHPIFKGEEIEGTKIWQRGAWLMLPYECWASAVSTTHESTCKWTKATLTACRMQTIQALSLSLSHLLAASTFLGSRLRLYTRMCLSMNLFGKNWETCGWLYQHAGLLYIHHQLAIPGPCESWKHNWVSLWYRTSWDQ